MKILFTIRFFPIYGGGETVTVRLANKFTDMGHEVHIFYLWDNGNQVIDSRIKVHKASNVHRAIGNEKINCKDIKSIYTELESYILNNKIEFVINQWLTPRRVYKAACGSAKVVHCRHAAVYVNSPKWNLCRRILGKTIFDYILSWKYKSYVKYSDKFLLLCKEYSEEMQKIYKNGLNKKIGFMYNPCRFEIPDINEYTQDKKNYVCYVGRLYPEKNVDVLIRAWKLVETMVLKKQWYFYIIGSGESLNELKYLVKELQCKNISFEGYRQPIEYYKQSKIFISASATEGYPMTIVEALAYGCVPIIANTFSALKEIIPDNKNGIKVNQVCYKEFGEKLNLLMQNDAILKEMSMNAYECSKKYNINLVAPLWIKLFEEIQST